MNETYTWKDLEELIETERSFYGYNIYIMPKDLQDRRKSMIEYFIDNPEELMKGGVFHDFNYSREQIIGSLKGNLYNSPSKGYATVVIL